MYELKQYEASLINQLKQHTEADDTFNQSLLFVLKLAKNATKLFESSNFEEKRQILGFITSNWQIQGKNVDFTYRKPFDEIAKGLDVLSWRPLGEKPQTAKKYFVSNCVLKLCKNVVKMLK